MNFRPALALAALLYVVFNPATANAERGHPILKTMTIDRRRVAHILHERRGGRSYVTMLIHGPFPWSSRAFPAPYRYECGEPAACAAFLRRLDEHLVLGLEVELSILSSDIESVSFLDEGRGMP